MNYILWQYWLHLSTRNDLNQREKEHLDFLNQLANK